ncbi:hypothetical protein ACFL6N_03980 [Thermodesulfobacteriota bacterium]
MKSTHVFDELCYMSSVATQILMENGAQEEMLLTMEGINHLYQTTLTDQSLSSEKDELTLHLAERFYQETITKQA